MRLSVRALVFVLVAASAAWAAACSLNPQPLPPDEGLGPVSDAGNKADAAVPPFGGDAALGSDAGSDAAREDDGGSDAARDGSQDAATDGDASPSDGATDAVSE